MFFATIVNTDPNTSDKNAVAVASGPVAVLNQVTGAYEGKIDISQAVRDVSLLIYREGDTSPCATMRLDKRMPWAIDNHSGTSPAGYIATPEYIIDAIVRGNAVVRTKDNLPWHFVEISIKPVAAVGLDKHRPPWMEASA